VLAQLPQYVPAEFSVSELDGCRLSKDARGRFYAGWQTASVSSFGMIRRVLEQERFNVGQAVDTHDSENEVFETSLIAACRLLVARFRHALPADARGLGIACNEISNSPEVDFTD
ncbi:MAG: hypothetical protein PF483_09760, partial [Halothiobacillus sp.]|jgi:hypothetical protein|nr:hypothetical protein [Halothiobacillus sp.]